MRRIATTLVTAAGGCLLFAQDAFAMHDFGHRDISSGIPWDTVALWSGIGVAVVLVAVWLMVEGRRRHWLPPHRPIHA